MQKGFTLVAAILIAVAMVFLAITISTLVSSDSIIAARNYPSQKAFHIAESGVQYYMKQLQADDDWGDPPTAETKAFGGGIFILATTDEAENQIIFTSTGMITAGAHTFTRAIKSSVRRTGSLGTIAEDYVIYWSGGGDPANLTEIENNIVINGNALVNSRVEIGFNTVINGDAYAAGDIDLLSPTSSITGTTEPNYDMPETTPTLETSYYDNELAIAAAQPAGDWTFKNITLSGMYYINGDVTMQSAGSVEITGTATIVATGKVTAMNEVTIGEGLTVIAGSDVRLWNLMNIDRDGLWYSSTQIEVGNDLDGGDPGPDEGIHFLSPGDIKVGNNTRFDGLLCADGTMEIGNNLVHSGVILCGYLKGIGNDNQLDKNPEATDWDHVPGIVSPGDSLETVTWEEVY